MATGDTTIALNNVDGFRRDYMVLDLAAIGVVFVRTREPHRVQSALIAYAKAKDNKPIRVWSVLSGMVDGNEESPTPDDQTKDITRALSVIQNDEQEALYIMLWPHWAISKMPIITVYLSEFSLRFEECNKRLVLLVPQEFEVPKELEDMIPIMDFDPPSQSELGLLYDALGQDFPNGSFPTYSKEEISRILSAGAGMTATEFSGALSRALITDKTLLPDVHIDVIVQRVMKLKTEVIKRSEVLELMPPGTMSDIGGLAQLKDWVKKRAACFSPEAAEFGIDRPKGCALIGPPGTGKTASGKAIASELGIPLIRFDVSRVFNSLVGSSEARVRGALKLLDVMAPCVVLVDELDKMFDTNSGGGDSGVGKRVLGAILTHLQEGTKPIFWVMTANRTEGLPPELLRKGRLDEIFSVTVPSEIERLEILKIHLRKRKQDPDNMEGLEHAAESSAGYVAAEIEAAVKEALIAAYSNNVPVTGELIVSQFRDMKPLSEAFKDQFDRMREWAEANARPASAEVAQVTARARQRGDGSSRRSVSLNLDG